MDLSAECEEGLRDSRRTQHVFATTITKNNNLLETLRGPWRGILATFTRSADVGSSAVESPSGCGDGCARKLRAACVVLMFECNLRVVIKRKHAAHTVLKNGPRAVLLATYPVIFISLFHTHKYTVG